MAFPSTLDSLTDPLVTDKLNIVSHSALHVAENTAIEALQAKVGADNSEVDSSHDYLLNNIDNLRGFSVDPTAPTNGQALAWNDAISKWKPTTVAGVPGSGAFETPSGAINGTNAVFTLTSVPDSGSLMLYYNGLLQRAGAGNDYTLSSATITFSEAPHSGAVIFATYDV